MNVKLRYLYRDAGNYKNFGEVVFTNAASLPLVDIEKSLRECMFDGGWFIADQWGLPDLHFTEFPWNSELDHDLHEFEGLEETDKVAEGGLDISAFVHMLSRLRKTN